MPSITSAAVADTTNLTTLTFLALQGGSSTQRSSNILEVFIGGQATASAPNYFLLSRDSTVFAGATSNAGLPGRARPLQRRPGRPAAGAERGLDHAAAALVDAALLNLSVNLFGGIVRWVAAPGRGDRRARQHRLARRGEPVGLHRLDGRRLWGAHHLRGVIALR
jgi:hypothetical protein